MKMLAFIPILFLASCAKQETAPVAELPHATVVMRDGTRVAGAVAASTPAEITINLDAGGSRTIPMKDVRRVDYGETASAVKPTPPATAPVPAEPGTAPPQQPIEPTHEDHEHARIAAIQSTRRVLPVGTEIPVRTEEAIDSGRAVEGQVYAAEIARDVKDAEGAVVIPRGSNAQIVIKSATKGGRFKGTADLVLDMKSVSIEGQQYRLDTADLASIRGRERLQAAGRRSARSSAPSRVAARARRSARARGPARARQRRS